MEISKEAILNKTHYGLNIYAHILRNYYPGTSVLSLSGKGCQPTKNPLNDNKETLKIEVVNNCAVHHDLEAAIPKGDVFDFAKWFYNLEGISLLQKLNEELNLNLDKKESFYASKSTAKQEPPTQKVKIFIPSFSYYRAPVKNIIPSKEMNLLQVYQLLRDNTFEARTASLRNFADKTEARKFKAAQFDYVTFSGTFSKRSDSSLIRHSGLMAVDFDHIDNIDELKATLLKDEYFETELMFVSPSGDGIKWIIPIDITAATQAIFFKAVANYIKNTYGLEVDQSGKDVSRACFLPHDAVPFINPKYLYQ